MCQPVREFPIYWFTQINRVLSELAANFLGIKPNNLPLCYHGFSDDACPTFKDWETCHIDFTGIYTTCPRPHSKGVYRGGHQIRKWDCRGYSEWFCCTFEVRIGCVTRLTRWKRVASWYGNCVGTLWALSSNRTWAENAGLCTLRWPAQTHRLAVF